MPELLVIDDEHAICSAFERFFARRGWLVRAAHSATEGERMVAESAPDVAFVDVRLPDRSGLDLLPRLANAAPTTALIVITAYGSMDTVASAVQANAFDYLPKPIDLDRAEQLVDQALQAKTSNDAPAVQEVRRYARQPAEPSGIVGRSGAMQDVFKTLARAARTDAAVLVRGETGTGKELVARAVHRFSARSAGPFVAVNGGALPGNLVEAELFGYEKGAFTGAEKAKPGRFEMADGGTLFLDEVGELPPEVQVKLLRFLDQQVIERLGAVDSRPLNVRIVAATNRDLTRAAHDGEFRADLYYRLAVVEIELPPLRERSDDILPLTGHLLSELSAPAPAPDITSEAAERLAAHDWPGNVRELRNALEHALVAAAGRTIRAEHLPATVRSGTGLRTPQSDGNANALQKYVDSLPLSENGACHAVAVEDLESRLIARAMDLCHGNQSRAAKLLGIHRNTLRQKLESLGDQAEPPAEPNPQPGV